MLINNIDRRSAFYIHLHFNLCKIIIRRMIYLKLIKNIDFYYFFFFEITIDFRKSVL